VLKRDAVATSSPYHVIALSRCSGITLSEPLRRYHAHTLVPGHGGVLKGKAFVQQEIELIEAVIAAMNQEIGHTTDPQKSFDEIKKAVERNVDMSAWMQKFAGDDPNERDFFEVFAWPGLLEAAHAEMWPR
jgi:hypothetical protein